MEKNIRISKNKRKINAIYKAKYGFEFNTKEKADNFNDGASACYGSCKSKNSPPDIACKSCILINECISCNELLDK